MPVKEFIVKVNTDTQGLQGAFDQLQKLADANPDVMKEFYSQFAGPDDVCSVGASAVVDGELRCILTASDRFLEFLAARQ